MSDIPINGIPGFDGIDFLFKSPLDLNLLLPFPDTAFTNGELSIATMNASASKKFSLGNAAENVEFNAGADGFSALGVYREADKVRNILKAEGLDAQVADLPVIKIEPDENLLALRWGYGFEAGAKGKIALVPTVPPMNLSFGASHKSAGLSVLLHTQKRSESVANSIANTLQTWRLPRQVISIEDLKPGTTVLYETMGKLGVSLGVEYGYDFSWARNDVKLGALSGDLKLKIEMGIKAQLGFSATGLYCLVISRPNADTKLRFQVFRVAERGWSFAFDGGLTSQFDPGGLPNNIDDFIKGVFNLNGSQIFKDLQKFFDKNLKIEDLIDAKVPELVDYAKSMVHKVTGIDPVAAAEDALKDLKELVTKWHALPHEMTSMIYGLLGKGTDLSKLRDFIAAAANPANDSEKIAGEITKLMEEEEFFTSPIGKWLTLYAEQGILSLLANIETEREALSKMAQKTKDLLDAGKVEGMLTELEKWIEEKLHFQTILDNTPADLDKWLKKRLADFLDKSSLVTEDLAKIREAIIKLRASAAEFYKKGYDALKEKYKTEIHLSFQKSTHKDALVDLTLDFGTDEAEAKKCLAEALDGDFSRILDKKIACVTINKAVFTHQIKRNTHIEVGLPYFHGFVDHINESKASGEVVEKNGKRLWVFTLKAFDIVKKKKSLSKLSLEAELTEDVEIRTFSDQSYQTNYKFQFGIEEAKRENLETRFDPAVHEYLRTEIPSFPLYLDEVDRHLDDKGLPGENKFGSVLASLEISLPGNVMSAWKNIPRDLDGAFFKQMSFAVQRRLREWILAVYVQGEKEYESAKKMYPLLAYSALPMLAAPMVDDGIPFFHWDYTDEDMRSDVFDSDCRANLLANILPGVQKATSKTAYANSSVDEIKKGIDSSKFITLCKFEKETIRNIVKTAKLYFEFLDTTQPADRLKALAEFGSEFGDTFNDDLGHIEYTPEGALRPLGLILIKDIAELLDPALDSSKFAVMWEMTVLKPGADFEKLRKNYFNNGETPSLEGTLLQQRVIGVQS